MAVGSQVWQPHWLLQRCSHHPAHHAMCLERKCPLAAAKVVDHLMCCVVALPTFANTLHSARMQGEFLRMLR